VIFGCFVFGAIATPSTDPFSMLALAALMALLFVAAIIAHPDPAELQLAAELVAPGCIEGDSALGQLSDPEPDEPEPRP
jgi:sec-independent protein translocase protein TatC